MSASYNDDIEARLDAAVRSYTNRALVWAGVVIMVMAGAVIAVIAVTAALGGPFRPVTLIVPVTAATIAAFSIRLARRERFDRRGGFLLVFFGGAIPSVAMAIGALTENDAPARAIHTTAWLFPVAIVGSGVFLDRQISRVAGLWCALQYEAAFLFARPDLLELTGPQGITTSLSSHREALIRFFALIAMGFVVGYVGDFARNVITRLVEEERARGRAEQSSAAKSAFLASMSHELRSPVSSILGYAQLVLDDEALPTERRADILRMRESGKHLLELIDDVLYAAKLQAGALSLEPQPTDVKRLTEGVVAALHMQRNEGVELEVHADVSPVMVDPKRLRQVLINVVGNALRLTTRGRVTVRAEIQDETLLFAIEDTGPGIAGEHLERIFEPFERADDTTEGTGLGLSISRKLVAMLGGEIGVDSMVGRGSTFTIAIPCTPAPALAAQEIVAPDEQSLQALLSWARRGNMKRLRSEAEAIANDNPDLQRFAVAIGRYADAFDDAGAIALLEDLAG